MSKNVISVFRSVGHYNFAAPKEESVSFGLRLPEGAPVRILSEGCEIGSEFDPGDEDDPFEVVELVERCANHWLINTGRVATLRACQWVRDNRASLELAWVEERIVAARAARKKAESEYERWMDRRDEVMDQRVGLAREGA